MSWLTDPRVKKQWMISFSLYYFIVSLIWFMSHICFHRLHQAIDLQYSLFKPPCSNNKQPLRQSLTWQQSLTLSMYRSSPMLIKLLNAFFHITPLKATVSQVSLNTIGFFFHSTFPKYDSKPQWTNVCRWDDGSNSIKPWKPHTGWT